ncbi:hypothetical protein TNCV_627111 [Trichonephila clavipes]|nr:hypothetical protein TNCV_627111 [Trichonephila clavipes]
MLDAMDRRLGLRFHHPVNIEQLKQMLIEQWALLPQELLNNPALSMNRSCRLSKWKMKTRRGISFVPALFKTLEEGVKRKTVYQDSPQDDLSNVSLEIELAIPFAPNQDPEDIP